MRVLTARSARAPYRRGSVDVRSNPRMTGPVPAGLHTVTPPWDWAGFCQHAYTEDNSACALLLSPGTGINTGKSS
jgi:hypothetical protein